MTKYIIRLDDLSGFSDLNKWKEILQCCRSNDVKCLVAVVPKCDDPKLKRQRYDDVHFWELVKEYHEMDVAMHGYNHEIFVGKPYTRQLKLMVESMKVFSMHRIIPDCFVAPKHLFDNNTTRVMRDLGMNYISDGVGLYPWRRMDYDIIQVPQILWKPRRVLFGIITFCLHPDTMTAEEITSLKDFIVNNKNDIISIYDVSLTPLEWLNIIFDPLYTIWFKLKFGRKPTSI